MIYMRAREQVKSIPQDMVLDINDAGIKVTAGGDEAYLLWKNVKNVIKEKSMTILVVDAGRGYMLSDKTLGEKKERFIRFVESRIGKKSK